jgi:hypothetical protein
MKLFKDSDGNTFAYEEDGSQDHLISPDLIPITSEEEQELNSAKYEAYLNTLSYSDRRRLEYPSIGDQLDALFHAGIFPAEMAARIQAIKDKYPKDPAP